MGITGMSGMWDPGHGWRNEWEKTDARRTERQVHDGLRDLEERIDKLTTVNYALWTLLQDRLGFTEEELFERVRTVDLLDGRADGKIKRREVAKCDECGRAMSKRHIRCMYCGSENLTIGAFDSVL